MLAALVSLGGFLLLLGRQFINFDLLVAEFALELFNEALLVTGKLSEGRSSHVEFQEYAVILTV